LGNNKNRIFVAAVSFWFMAESLDFISTALALALIPNMMESNPFGTNPNTGQVSFLGMLFAKTLWSTFAVAFPGLCLYLGTKRSSIASLPVWYAGWNLIPAILNNFSYLAMYTWTKGGF
jgi:hypothetical protein